MNMLNCENMLTAVFDVH